MVAIAIPVMTTMDNGRRSMKVTRRDSRRAPAMPDEVRATIPNARIIIGTHRRAVTTATGDNRNRLSATDFFEDMLKGTGVMAATIVDEITAAGSPGNE